MKNLKIRITGLVQGVFFRSNTRKKAQELKLCGFVRNETDGSVFIEVEGEEKSLKRFCNWCRNGPESARVHDIEMEEGEYKNYKSFDIRVN